MKIQEPSSEDVKKLMDELNISLYEARERLREEAYREEFGSQKPKDMSWGDFWKSY